jgi:hypothetical protein
MYVSMSMSMPVSLHYIAGKGSGLGLSIAKRLIILHSGTVGCSSVPKKRTEFWFTAALLRLTADEERDRDVVMDDVVITQNLSDHHSYDADDADQPASPASSSGGTGQLDSPADLIQLASSQALLGVSLAAPLAPYEYASPVRTRNANAGAASPVSNGSMFPVTPQQMQDTTKQNIHNNGQTTPATATAAAQLRMPPKHRGSLNSITGSPSPYQYPPPIFAPRPISSSSSSTGAGAAAAAFAVISARSHSDRAHKASNNVSANHILVVEDR